MKTQTATNLHNEGRIVALEVNQKNAGKLSAKLSGVIAAVGTAVINGVFLLLGGQR